MIDAGSEDGVQIGKTAAEGLGDTRADVQDSQAVKHPPHVAGFAGLDAVQEIARGFLAHPFEVRQFVKLQPVKVGDVAHQTAFDQLRDERFAAAFDVHRAARTPMLDPAADLGRTIGVGAAPDGSLAFGGCALGNLRAALGTFLGETKGLLVSRSFVGEDAHDFGNDFARLLDHDPVADPHVEASNLVVVVQGGAFNGGAGEKDRLEFGHWGKRAGAAHLDRDGLQFCFGLVGRVFKGHAPAGRFGGGAQALAQRDGVEFDHGAVGLVREPGADFVEFIDRFEQFIDGATVPVFLGRFEAERTQPVKQFHLGQRPRAAFDLPCAIENDVELAFGDQARVELFE